MVTIGYSYPCIARYDGSSGKDKYTECMDLGGGVSYSDSVEVSDENNFYANDKIWESESGEFVSGEATITIDALSPAAAKLGLGVKNTTSISETSWDDYDDDATPPELGYGHVKATMEKGVKQYWGVVLPRIKMALPGESAETKEENINWQTQELTATILRSKNGKHKWRSVTSTSFSTSEEAYEAVKAYLSQTGGA